MGESMQTQTFQNLDASINYSNFSFCSHHESFGWDFKPRFRLHDLVVSGTLN